MIGIVARFDPRTWPIRWQLTALNVGVHAATLIALSVIFLAQLDSALVGLTAENVRDKVRLLADDRRPPPDEIGRGPGDVGRPPSAPPGDPGRQQAFSLPRAAAVAVRRLSGPDSGVMVFDPSGALVDATQTFDDDDPWPTPPPEQVAQALAGGERSTIVRREQHRTLLLAVPLPGPEGTVAGALVLARSLELIDAVQSRLLLLLVAGVTIAVVVGGGLGLRATRQALRPLDRVIQAARAIESG